MTAVTGPGRGDSSTNLGTDDVKTSPPRESAAPTSRMDRISLFVKSFFVDPNPPKPIEDKKAVLDRLWKEKKIDALVAALEQEANHPAGISWRPSADYKKAPRLPNPLPELSKCGRDLNLIAEVGFLDSVVGRTNEINKIAEFFGQRQKNIPILIGDSGVGKTAIASGIAQKIVKDEADLPAVFKGRRIFRFSYEYVALLGFERFDAAIKQALDNKENVILFFDDIHAFFQDKNLAKILKFVLSVSLLSCIGTTSLQNYNEMIKTHPVLERQFCELTILEPSEQDLRQMLRSAISLIEIHHGVHIDDTAVEECIKLAARYLKNQNFPDKAIHLLDRAASQLNSKRAPKPQDKSLSAFLKLLIWLRGQVDGSAQLDQKIEETRLKFSKTVTADVIREIVAEKIQLPLQRIQESEKELLNQLETLMSKKIIGQKDSIASLCQGIRRARLKIGSSERPAGVFLMLGPTGVGKTESAKVLSRILYGSEDNILRLDMSEYQHPSDATKLIGAPPGYKDHALGGKLTNWLKKKPHSIVILDEIEKAHPRIFDLLLGVLDAGRITDASHETIRCQDTVFIITSNIGSKDIVENYQKLTKEELARVLDASLEKTFRPEFIGRIQEIVTFYPLSEDEARQISELRCKELKERVEKNTSCPDLRMEWDDSLIQFLTKTYYDPKRGARGIANGITRRMETPISDQIIQGKITPGAKIRFSSDGRQVKMTVDLPPN